VALGNEILVAIETTVKHGHFVRLYQKVALRAKKHVRINNINEKEVSMRISMIWDGRGTMDD
jgi:hypothetical protein